MTSKPSDIVFYRARTTTKYVIEDRDAGYYREVDLDDAIKMLAYPIIYEACWRGQTENLGVDPTGKPLADKSPAKAAALQKDG